MLEINHVNKSFRGKNAIDVISDISFSVKKGDFVCIVGPSGCGKTVFLRMLASLLSTSAGDIMMDGKPVDKPDTRRILMFQNYALFPWLTVQGNILFGLSSLHISKGEKQKRINDALQMINLEKFRDWYPHKLSGGMQQRVALARSLVAQPEYLLMDEPFSAVDALTRRQLRKNLVEIWQRTKTAIVFVTHGISEAVYLGETVYVFSSCPARIIGKFPINLPRPRDQFSPEFSAACAEIEKKLIS